MRTRLWIVLVTGILICGLAIGTVSALSISTAWKTVSPGGQPMKGITISGDGSRVLVSSNTMGLSSDGKNVWGGYDSGIAAMSDDGNYVVTATGTSIRMLDRTGSAIWSRSMGYPVSAVAISPNGSLVATADTSGYIRTWGNLGESYGTVQMDPASDLGIVPSADLVVIASDRGLRYINPGLDLVWSDNRTDSLDTVIVIPPEGSAIYTAGGGRVSSHSKDGTLNWQKQVTSQPITDISCSGNGNVIVVGSQDGTVYILDSAGTTRAKYPAGQWINAVGVSRDGTLIAAGSIDSKLALLSRDGTLSGSTKTSSIIQPRSVAVNPDGSRVVVSDQTTLYGFKISPDPVLTTPTSRVRTTTGQTTIETPGADLTMPDEEMTTEIPDTTPAPTQSPPAAATGILALGLVLVFRKRSQ